MRLFIAEKPELAKAIVAGLGGSFERKDGYFTDGSDCVAYCAGHMLQLVEPDEIDEKYRWWNMEDLPLPPNFPPVRKIMEDKEKQVAVIARLLKQADLVVHAGDPDDEGQLLVDELLRFFNNTKPVMRLLINDNNVNVVKKALNNMKSNTEYEHLGYKAESRAIADQLFGFNFTRGYSLQYQSMTGERETLHVGRVKTPILGLVVRRDRENANHQKSFYYQVISDFSFNNLYFKAKYQIGENDPIDDDKRLIDKAFADNIAALCIGQTAKIYSIQTTHKKEPAPLPYNLLKLQQDASRKFGYKPDEVMNITQSLREKHQLITYNRSDCQYLSDEQFEDVSSVLEAIGSTFSLMAGACKNANPSFKGRVFNSAKVSAHHAIIPTQSVANWDSLSEEEQNIYKIIARNYIAQFYPLYEYDETKIVVVINHQGKNYYFGATARVDTAIGWKKLYNNDVGNEETAVDDDVDNQDLRQLSQNSMGQCTECVATSHEAKPQPLYTMTTLLGDLTKVAKYVKNPELAKILKDKDKDKQGEHGGIGTPATRSEIIKQLMDGGYFAEKGKSIISTKKAQKLYDSLADLIRFPDMTAVWHEQQKEITNQNDVGKFLSQMMEDIINPTIFEMKKTYVKPVSNQRPTAPCPKCGRDMIKRDSKFEKGKFYWSCTGYSDAENPCNHTMDDNNGVPIEREAKPNQNLTDFDCKECGKKLIWRKGFYKKGKNKGKPFSFFGCSGYPSCTQNYDEVNGVPKYD